MKITSLQNNLIKLYASLKLKKNRDLHRLFLLEGIDLLLEAKTNNLVKTILYVDEIPLEIEDVEYIEVTPEIIKKISTQVTPGKFIAICNFMQENYQKSYIVIALDGVQDPGNGGTILRSAIAFGFEEILLSKDSFDIYNDKFLRASKGAVFNINIKKVDLVDELKSRLDDGYQVLSTSVVDSTSYDNFKYQNKVCLVLGNEGQGISKEVFDISTHKIHIPMSEKMESLNVGVAGSIIMSKIFISSK